MKDEWRAETVKRLFQYEIPRDDLAKEAQMTTAYLNMIIAGTRNPPNAEETLTSALDRLIKQKNQSAERGRPSA